MLILLTSTVNMHDQCLLEGAVVDSHSSGWLNLVVVEGSVVVVVDGVDVVVVVGKKLLTKQRKCE